MLIDWPPGPWRRCWPLDRKHRQIVGRRGRRKRGARISPGSCVLRRRKTVDAISLLRLEQPWTSRGRRAAGDWLDQRSHRLDDDPWFSDWGRWTPAVQGCCRSGLARMRQSTRLLLERSLLAMREAARLRRTTVSAWSALPIFLCGRRGPGDCAIDHRLASCGSVLRPRSWPGDRSRSARSKPERYGWSRRPALDRNLYGRTTPRAIGSAERPGCGDGSARRAGPWISRMRRWGCPHPPMSRRLGLPAAACRRGTGPIRAAGLGRKGGASRRGRERRR